MRIQDAPGFTLIELMITVAVVGILAAIAYPSYQDSIRKSRRADAKSALLDAAHRQERFFTENNQYTNVLVAPGGCTGAACGLSLPRRDHHRRLLHLDVECPRQRSGQTQHLHPHRHAGCRQIASARQQLRSLHPGSSRR